MKYTRARRGLLAIRNSVWSYRISVADLEIQKGGFSHWRAKRARKFLGCHAHFRHAGTEYLEATLGLVKCLEISKELIRECVTMPGCCCCMPLLHNHLNGLVQLCTQKYITRRQRGVHFAPPLPPPPPLNPPLNFASTSMYHKCISLRGHICNPQHSRV